MTWKFNYVACSIEESKGTTDLSIDEFQNSLLIHEKIINRQVLRNKLFKSHPTIIIQKVVVGGRGRGNNSGGGRHLHRIFEKDSKGRGRSFDKNNNSGCYKAKSVDKWKVKCYIYHIYDQYKLKCRTNCLNGNDGRLSNF